MEANSYKRSAQDEFHKNKDLFNNLNKLKREQNNLQNNFKTCLDKFNCLKEEYSKLIQITSFQHQNLDQVLSVCCIAKYIIFKLNFNFNYRIKTL